LLTAAAERSLDARWKASLGAAAEVASDVPVLADLVPVLQSGRRIVAARAALDIGDHLGKLSLLGLRTTDGSSSPELEAHGSAGQLSMDSAGRPSTPQPCSESVADGGASVPASAGVAGTHVQPRGPAAVVLEATLEVGRRLRADGGGASEAESEVRQRRRAAARRRRRGGAERGVGGDHLLELDLVLVNRPGGVFSGGRASTRTPMHRVEPVTAPRARPCVRATPLRPASSTAARNATSFQAAIWFRPIQK
jgi:hypothetical protein